MLGDLRQSNAAVRGGLKQTAALYADDGHEDVNGSHQQAAENTCTDGAARHGIRLVDAQSADDLHHHDAEGKACQRVHRVVPLQEAGKERLGGIGALRRDTADRGTGIDHGNNDQDTEKREEAGIEYLAYPHQYLARLEREEQRRAEEQEGKEQQVHLRAPVVRQYLLQSHGKRGSRATGNGKERPDSQVEQAGEEQGVGASDTAPQLKKSVRATDSERGNAEQGQSHAGHAQSDDCKPDVFARHLTHVYGKYQVACSEKQSEKHTGDISILTAVQFLFHLLSSVVLYCRIMGTAYAASCRALYRNASTAAITNTAV